MKRFLLPLRLAFRHVRRDYRAGELRTLALAVMIGVAAHTAVQSLINRIDGAMRSNANELLGADLALRSRTPFPDTWLDEAERRGFEVARTVVFPSVVVNGDASQLVQVKAVSERYPLRGTLEIGTQPYMPGAPTEESLTTGRAWADSRIFAAMDLAVGDRVDLGEIDFTLDAVLTVEPDRAGDFFGVAPRVMIPLVDLERTGLIGAGSRVIHSLLLTGDANGLASYSEWVEPQFTGRQWIVTLDEAQQNVSSALDRAQRFLSLAALTAVVVVAVAILIVARRFAQRHIDSVALLRCLGAPQRTAVLSLGLQLLIVGLVAGVIGIAVGLLGQGVLISLLGEVLPDDLPPPGLLAPASGMLLAVMMLLGFGVPPLMRLRQVPPMAIFKRDQQDLAPASRWLNLFVLGASFGLAAWMVNDALLAGWVLGGVAATALVLGIAALLLIAGARRLLSDAGVSWRYGVANIARHRGASLLQIIGLGLGLMVIVLLAVVRTELLTQWRDSLPEGTPNIFVANIQPDQAPGVEDAVRDLGVEDPRLFPMAVARLAAINGAAPDPADYADPRARRRIEGTINISWTDRFPAGNRLVDGEFWAPDTEAAEVSLATTWAEVFDLEVGDTVTFLIGAEEITATVSNLREVKWDSFNVNFFILLSPPTERDVPRSYVTSFHIGPDQGAQLTGLVRAFPNVSLFDIDAIISRVRAVIDRVNVAVEFVFTFTLAAGFIVLLAALEATYDERRHQSALLRAFGARRQRLRSMQLAEFGLIGALAGFLAAAAALVMGWVVAEELFGLDYAPRLWWLAPITLLSAAIVGAAGLFASRRIVRASPMNMLRRS